MSKGLPQSRAQLNRGWCLARGAVDVRMEDFDESAGAFPSVTEKDNFLPREMDVDDASDLPSRIRRKQKVLAPLLLRRRKARS